MTEPLRAPSDGSDLSVAIVRSRFNDVVTQRLLDGARETLRRASVEGERCCVVEVPGSVEIPLAVELLARQRRWDGVVCLGAVIQGETRHFDYVCRIAADGVREVSLRHALPVGFGVLTCETMEQALARSTPGGDNRGCDAALAVLEMANLARRLRPESG